jgi:hypothetical protein
MVNIILLCTFNSNDIVLPPSYFQVTMMMPVRISLSKITCTIMSIKNYLIVLSMSFHSFRIIFPGIKSFLFGGNLWELPM